MKKALFVLLIFSTLCHGQISYRSKYAASAYVEAFGMGPFFSFGVEKVLEKKPKDFTTIRGGVGLIFGDNNFNFSDTRFSLPVSISKGFIVNNIKNRIRQRVSLRCNAQPPKVVGEAFFELGIGYTPLFYSQTDIRHRIYGQISTKQHIYFDRPPKPKVYYVKLSYNPYYSFFRKNTGNFEGLVFLPKTTAVVAGISLGVSIQ